MSRRKELEAAVARAETGLGRAISAAAMVDAVHADASVQIEKARANCRQARSALNQLIRSEP